MKKAALLKIVNLLLLLFILTQVFSGLFHSKLPLEVFEWMHERGGMVLIVLIALHLWLNWSWIRMNYLTFQKK